MHLKRLLFVALTALASQSAAAGEIRADMLPDSVKKTFASLYPSVVAVEWDWDEDRHAYEAEAKIDHREVEVLIEENGELVQAKEDVFADQIPDEVLKEIRQKWPRAELILLQYQITIQFYPCRSPTADSFFRIHRLQY